MNDADKMKEQLIDEVAALRQENAEHQRIEHRLKKSEERLKILFEYAPDGYFLCDQTGVFVDGNRAAEDLVGYKREELIGKSFLTLPLLPPDQLPKAAQLLAQIIPGQPTGPDVFTLNRKDGGQRVVEISTYPINMDGQTLVLGIARDITARQQAETQIQTSLQEKEVLLKELHHRVMNHLQLISSLFDLQAGYLEGRSPHDLLQESRNRVRAINLVHQQLYQSPDLTQIDSIAYLRDLVRNLFFSYNIPPHTIALDLRIEEGVLELDTAVPCGLIVNELVTNALQHAFPKGRKGEIHIALCRVDDQRFILTVRDNGVGLPPGVDPYQAESLGLKLVASLVRQLRGRTAFCGQGGTEITLTLGS